MLFNSNGSTTLKKVEPNLFLVLSSGKHFIIPVLFCLFTYLSDLVFASPRPQAGHTQHLAMATQQLELDTYKEAFIPEPYLVTEGNRTMPR